MTLIQGGPPEWIWERKPERLKWEVIPSQSPAGHTVYELRVNCGLEIMRLVDRLYGTAVEGGRLEREPEEVALG